MLTPPNMLHTIYKGQPSGAGLSPKLWSEMRNVGLSPDGYAAGNYAGDNFMGFGIGTAVNTNVGYYVSEGGTYKSFEDTGGSIAGTPGVGGQVLLSVDADDDQECWLQHGSSGGTLGAISSVAGSDKLTIFESRFKISTLVGNMFIGLTEEAFAANDAITDAGALASKDAIGFFVTEGAGSTLTFVYRKAGQTMQTVIASAATLVADTWVKVGFAYNPAAKNDEKIKIFVNNTELSTYVTRAMMYTDSTATPSTTFPDAQQLTFSAGIKNVTDIKTMTLDWWHFWQSY